MLLSFVIHDIGTVYAAAGEENGKGTYVIAIDGRIAMPPTTNQQESRIQLAVLTWYAGGRYSAHNAQGVTHAAYCFTDDAGCLYRALVTLPHWKIKEIAMFRLRNQLRQNSKFRRPYSSVASLEASKLHTPVPLPSGAPRFQHGL